MPTFIASIYQFPEERLMSAIFLKDVTITFVLVNICHIWSVKKSVIDLSKIKEKSLFMNTFCI